MYQMKFLWAAICGLLFFSACKKESSCPYANPTVKATATEIAALQDFLQVNNITATQDGSGIFYTITTNGQGAVASMCSFWYRPKQSTTHFCFFAYGFAVRLCAFLVVAFVQW